MKYKARVDSNRGERTKEVGGTVGPGVKLSLQVSDRGTIKRDNE